MYIPLNLPEKQLNEWSIQSFHENGVKYQKLMKGNMLMMANTPDIVADYVEFLETAQGSVLINGLGIGMCSRYLVQKDTITDITVIEYNENIFNLIAPSFENEYKCTVIHGDAFTYTPPVGKYYDYVWHDIWTYYASKNLKDIAILMEKYQTIAGQQGAWSYQKCVELKNREQVFY